MARKRVESWVVTDEFWQRVEALIPERGPQLDKTYLRKPGAGRPPKPARQVFEAIVYVLRTGCQWKALTRSNAPAGYWMRLGGAAGVPTWARCRGSACLPISD